MTTVAEAMLKAWEPIANAPKGTTRQVTNAKGTRDVFVAAWIWTCRTSDGHVTKSHWLPDEDRWNGWTKDAGPDLWQAIVTPEAPVLTSLFGE